MTLESETFAGGCPYCPSPPECGCPDTPAVCREGGSCACDPEVCPCPGKSEPPEPPWPPDERCPIFPSRPRAPVWTQALWAAGIVALLTVAFLVLRSDDGDGDASSSTTSGAQSVMSSPSTTTTTTGPPDSPVATDPNDTAGPPVEVPADAAEALGVLFATDRVEYVYGKAVPVTPTLGGIEDQSLLIDMAGGALVDITLEDAARIGERTGLPLDPGIYALLFWKTNGPFTTDGRITHQAALSTARDGDPVQPATPDAPDYTGRNDASTAWFLDDLVDTGWFHPEAFDASQGYIPVVEPGTPLAFIAPDFALWLVPGRQVVGDDGSLVLHASRFLREGDTAESPTGFSGTTLIQRMSEPVLLSEPELMDFFGTNG